MTDLICIVMYIFLFGYVVGNLVESYSNNKKNKV